MILSLDTVNSTESLSDEEKKKYLDMANDALCSFAPSLLSHQELAMATIRAITQVKKLERQCITVFFGDRVPTVRSGLPVHELEELLTVEQVTGFIEKIKSQETSEDPGRACVHPPGCQSCSWCGFKAADNELKVDLL